MERLIFLILFLFTSVGFSQIDRQGRNPKGGSLEISRDPSQSARGANAEVEKPPITDYKIISIDNDTTFVDTTLTLQKDYRFNYLRKDNFGLLPFSNVGQTYNTLVPRLEREDEDFTPEFGARARHFNFFEVEDIYYYHVPTPFTEVFFKTVFEQGQTLESLFSVNTSPNLNLSIGYKGLRSLGKYQHLLTSTGNFQMTVNYQTPNRRYRAKAHFVSQDLLNQENGGLSPLALEQYLSGNEEYQDRSRLQMNFTDAESTLFGKRFYLNHSYDITSPKDSTSSNRLSVGHILDFSDKKFIYRQASASELMGPAFESVSLDDEVKLRNIYNRAYLAYDHLLLGKFKVKAALSHYNYGYNSVLILEEGRIDNRLIGENFAVGGAYTNTFGPFDLSGDLSVGMAGDYTGMNLDAALGIDFGGRNRAEVRLRHTDEAPNFNFLLYQSDYVNYNWQNAYENVVTSGLEFTLLFPRLVNLNASYNTITDYTYFTTVADNLVKPFQHGGTVNHFKLEARKQFRLGMFGLDNTVAYQNVLDGQEVFHVPDFVTRNTLFFEDEWFDKALFLQTGFTLNYFTNYYMDAYDPVLAEFYVQNEQEIEGFPSVDFFFNGKIRQARVFFTLEQVNALLMGNDNFSAPLHPYRDFGVRFGLVWNFFM